MHSTDVKKTLVQCDFDGTITEEDVSFLLLDAFANGDWRRLLREYREGKITVNHFNTRAFSMVKADRLTLVKFARDKVKIRPGFHQLVAYCQRRGFRFVIVSNGLDLYIEAILKDAGLGDIEVLAAKSRFSSEGLNVAYIGPEGTQLEDGFKEAYSRSFLGEGYRIIYIGNGPSDISPARYAQLVFARDELLAYYAEANLNYMSFVDLNDVVQKLKHLRLDWNADLDLSR